MNTAIRERLTQFHLRSQQEWVPLVEGDVGQLPLIDHNPRKGEKIDFVPQQAFLSAAPPSASTLD